MPLLFGGFLDFDFEIEEELSKDEEDLDREVVLLFFMPDLLVACLDLTVLVREGAIVRCVAGNLGVPAEGGSDKSRSSKLEYKNILGRRPLACEPHPHRR